MQKNVVLAKKTCKDCKLLKRVDCFSLADKFGHRRGVCQSCMRYKKSKDMWLQKRLIKELFKRGKRKCSKCHTVKNLNEFPNDFKGRVYNNKKSYCKACGKIMRLDYLDRNKGKRAQWDKKHRIKYKDRYNQVFYDRLASDPAFKMRHSLRTNLNKILRRKGLKKRTSVVKSIGCSEAFLIEYLESKFYPNKETGEKMTWENHGVNGWHLDHIRPLCSFDLTDPEQVIAANHYTNLQPLWAKENLEKRGKYDDCIRH